MRSLRSWLRALRTGGRESVAPGSAEYWRLRAAKLGRRSVFDARHSDAELEAVTAMQRAAILPVLHSELNGREQVVLDYGSGWGRFVDDLQQATGAHVVALDPVHQLLQQIPRTATVSPAVCGGGQIPLRDGSIDVIWLAAVLGAIVDEDLLRNTCSELLRVLAPGGLMVITENTSRKADIPHYRYRTVESYVGLFPTVALTPRAEYADFDELFTVLAGRRSP